MLEKIKQWFRGTKTVEGPTFKDCSVALKIGHKSWNVMQLLMKLWWNLVNIVYNARAIVLAVKKALKEVDYA